MKHQSETTPIRELKTDELRTIFGAGRDACYYSYSSGTSQKFSSNSNNSPADGTVTPLFDSGLVVRG